MGASLQSNFGSPTGNVAVAAKAPKEHDYGRYQPAAAELTLTRILRVLAIASAVAALVIVLIDIIGTNIDGYYLTETVDAGSLVVITLALVGGAVTASEEQHIFLSPVGKHRPNWSAFAFSLSHMLTAGYCILLCVEGIRQSVTDWPQLAGTLGITATVMDIPMAIGFAAIGLSSIMRLRRVNRRALAVAMAIVAVLITISQWVRASDFLQPGIPAVVVVAALMAVMVAIGTPLAITLGLGGVIYIYLTSVTFEISVFTNIQNYLSNFVLLAVPFFIFTGLVMSEGGLSDQLSAFLSMLTARIRGGLWDVMIASMFVFSGISGSKVADVAAVGASMEPVLKRLDYPSAESAAILAAAAAGGETIPPSTAMILLGTVTSVAISTLFAAGVVPALFILVGLAVVAHIRNRKRAFLSAPRADRSALRITLNALPAFCIPIVLVGGIILGIGTATEVAASSTVLSLLASRLLYRRLSPTVLWEILKRFITLNGSVLFLVGGAGAFAYVLSIAQVPDLVASEFSHVAGGHIVFVLCSILVLMVFGALLEGLPAILIFGPILVPSAIQIGLNPVQFGITFLIALGVGVTLPPLGVVLNVSCKLFGTRVEGTFRAMAVYTGWLAACSVTVGLVPWIALVVPRALHLTT